MRLIDKDELKANIEQFNRPLCDDYHMKHYVLNQIITDIENQPTVDAVPVIRCVDCKYSEHWYRDKRRCFLWVEDGIDVFDDGYCNYGQTKAERKDDETD